MLIRIGQRYNLGSVSLVDWQSEQYLKNVDDYFGNTFMHMKNGESPWAAYQIIYPSVRHLLNFSKLSSVLNKISFISASIYSKYKNIY